MLNRCISRSQRTGQRRRRTGRQSLARNRCFALLSRCARRARDNAVVESPSNRAVARTRGTSVLSSRSQRTGQHCRRVAPPTFARTTSVAILSRSISRLQRTESHRQSLALMKSIAVLSNSASRSQRTEPRRSAARSRKAVLSSASRSQRTEPRCSVARSRKASPC